MPSAHPRPVIRIVLVGSQRVVLDSLAGLIAGEPDLNVLNEQGQNDGSEKPDVALFDLDEADDAGVFEHLRETATTTRTIAMSISTGTAVSLRVFQAGAVGLVSKRQPPGHLMTAIRKVHAGEAWLGRTMIANLIDMARADRQKNGRAEKSGGGALSERDRRLIALVGEGWRNADIARLLAASEATVRASLTSIFRKLGVPNRFALMIYAAQHGYVNNGSWPRQAGLSR